MSKNRFNLNLENIVVGSSLEAILYAFYNKYKLIYTRLEKPDQFSKIEDYGLGTDTSQAWSRHVFLLSLAGYVPFADKVKHIRYIDSKTIKVITEDESVSIITFDKLYIFDDHNFLDLPLSPATTSDRIKIIDWFYVERGTIHDYNLIQNNNDFMNQVIFFRNNARKHWKRKDVCVVSYCNKSELDDTPEHIVRIKTEQLMRDLGIQTATEHRTHIKIDHQLREVRELGKNIYENFDNVRFMYDDAKFIYEVNQKRRKIDYMKYLSMRLGI